MGRPPLPPGTARTVTYSVKFTEHEARCLACGANAYGESVPEYIRRVLNDCVMEALSKSLEIKESMRLADERKAERKRVLDERRRKKGK